MQRRIRFDLQIGDPANAAVRVATVPVYVCPSEPRTGTFTVVDANGNGICDVARGSYTAMNGVLGVSGDAWDNNGAFVRNRGMRIADITDGLSTTLVRRRAGHQHVECHLDRGGDQRRGAGGALRRT